MLGAPVAAHALCAPIAGGEATEIIVPFGLGAVAGGGYNPPQSLSSLYRKRDDEPDEAPELVELVDDLIDDTPPEPQLLFDVRAFWDQYQAEQAAAAERLAQAQTLNRALQYDEGEVVLRMWQAQEDQARDAIQRLVLAAAELMRSKTNGD